MNKNAILGFQLARAAAYLGQNLSLPLIEFLAYGENRFKENKDNKLLIPILKDLFELFQKDSDNISRGLYPLSVLTPRFDESPLMYPKLVLDGLRVAKRRQQKKSKEFTQKEKKFFDEVPEYFQRNFHFQSGGYLSKDSADIYDYQVEVLFAGAAQPMRRLMLPPLVDAFPKSKGEGLKILEIACGTGSLSSQVAEVFPEARLTLLDLSSPYLKKAQDKLKNVERVDFVQGDAAKLPFPDKSFDAVISCFLFHELPMIERKKVIAEAKRVLKPKGFMGHVDSIQNHDAQHFKFALEQFPVSFHEPFYKNYIQNPLEKLVIDAGFKKIKSERGFFSKVVSARV